ncbi:MAG: hypothetical protein WCM76_02600 [Bacteroidota bacterium]
MMRKLKFYFMSALALLLVQSCGSKADKADIARIDSVYAVVETTGQELNKLNFDTLNTKNEMYKANAKVLTENIYELKNDETWPWICAYGNVRKPFKTMVAEYPKYKSELDTCRKQLNDMKHDLDNGALSKSDFETNFLIECSAVNDLTGRIIKNLNSVKAQLKSFDTVHPAICRIIKEFQENEAKHPGKGKKEQGAPEETD